MWESPLPSVFCPPSERSRLKDERRLYKGDYILPSPWPPNDSWFIADTYPFGVRLSFPPPGRLPSYTITSGPMIKEVTENLSTRSAHSNAKSTTNLFGRLHGDKLDVNLFGSERQLLRVLYPFVLFAGDPKIDILLAELALKKRSEQLTAVWKNSHCVVARCGWEVIFGYFASSMCPSVAPAFLICLPPPTTFWSDDFQLLLRFSTALRWFSPTTWVALNRKGRCRRLHTAYDKTAMRSADYCLKRSHRPFYTSACLMQQATIYDACLSARSATRSYPLLSDPRANSFTFTFYGIKPLCTLREIILMLQSVVVWGGDRGRIAVKSPLIGGRDKVLRVETFHVTCSVRPLTHWYYVKRRDTDRWRPLVVCAFFHVVTSAMLARAQLAPDSPNSSRRFNGPPTRSAHHKQ